jgi:hypothetical protein
VRDKVILHPYQNFTAFGEKGCLNSSVFLAIKNAGLADLRGFDGWSQQRLWISGR